MPDPPGEPAPLRLGLRPFAPDVPLGGDAVFELSQEVFRDLHMETVELNGGRTEILLERLEPDPAAAVLTTRDHVSLHKPPIFTPIGRSADVPGGSRWAVTLSLLAYHRPLSVGRYRVTLRYRYGETGEAVVATPAAEFRVVPTAPVKGSRRWSGGGKPRRFLEAVWVTPLIWMYQVSVGDDPSAVKSVANLGIERPPPEDGPLIAHLHGTPEEHFERYVLWIDGGALHWTTVSYVSRRSEVFSAPLPEGRFRLVDPPLQLASGACAATLVGVQGASSAVLVAELDSAGACALRVVPSRIGPDMNHVGTLWPDAAAGTAGVMVAGRRGERALHALELATGRAYGCSLDGRLEAFAIDQNGGRGAVFVLVDQDDHHVLQRFDPDLGAPRTLCRYALAGAPEGLAVDALEPLASLEGAAVLYRHGKGWLVRNGDQSFAVPPVDQGPLGVWMTAGPRRLSITAYRPDRGFTALGLGHELVGNRL